MLTAGRAAKKILSRFPGRSEEAAVGGDMGGVWKLRHPIKVTRMKAKIPLVTGPGDIQICFVKAEGSKSETQVVNNIN